MTDQQIKIDMPGNKTDTGTRLSWKTVERELKRSGFLLDDETIAEIVADKDGVTLIFG